jgi:hypothetical protein
MSIFPSCIRSPNATLVNALDILATRKDVAGVIGILFSTSVLSEQLHQK